MKVPAVAFSFTRPDAVVVFGKDWVDADGSRYQLHPYPSKSGLSLSDDRPNVVLLVRADKKNELAPYGDKIHRVVFFGTPTEIGKLDIPILDGMEDQTGKIVCAGRTSISALNAGIEDEASAIELAAKKVKKISNTKVKSKKKVKTLGGYLDEIENELQDGDVWEDLEKPVITYITGDTTKGKFKKACKALIDEGVPASQIKPYYKWVIKHSEDLSSALTAVEDSGDSPNIKKIAKTEKINVNDLAVVLSLYEYLTTSEDEEEE